MAMPSFLGNCVMVVAILLCVAAAAQGEGFQGEDQRIDVSVDALVRRLGNKSYAEREAAQQQLLELGEAVREAVAGAVDDPDAEIRVRSRRILEALDALALERRRRELAAALEQFVDRPKPDGAYNFPTWDRFRKTVGEDKPARAILAEAIRQETGLFLAAERGAESLAKSLQERLQEEWFRSRMGRGGRASLAPAATAALLWLSMEAGVQLDRNHGSLLYTSAVQPTFVSWSQGDDRAAAIQRLLGAWVAHDHGDDATLQQYKLHLAQQRNLPQGVVVASRLLKEAEAAHTLHQCILLLARHGEEKHIAVLETQLGNMAVCSTSQVQGAQYQAQVRDLALAALVRITRQDPAPYGYWVPYTGKLPDDDPRVRALTLGYPANDTQQREAAIQRWRERRGKNPPKGRKQQDSAMAPE